MMNAHMFVESRTLRLVPYLSCFTPRYHEWMCDEELLALTESEPLTLEEECANQRDWLAARDKLTFILLSPCFKAWTGEGEGMEPLQFPTDDAPAAMQGEEVRTPPFSSSLWVREGEAGGSAAADAPYWYRPQTIRSVWSGEDSPLPMSPRPTSWVMIGDCNLFLLNDDDDEEEDGNVFEVEVMVADASYRRRGLASEAARLLMLYAAQVLGATRFVAKVLDTNEGSLRLFQQVLGFTLLKRVPVFHETHLVLRLHSLQEREAWLHDVRFSNPPTSESNTEQFERCIAVGPYDSAEHTAVPVLARTPL